MDTGVLKLAGTEAKYSFLRERTGEWLQFYYTIIPDVTEPIEEQASTIERAEAELFNTLDIADTSPAFKRFFSSDLITHHDTIVNYKNRQNSDYFMSLTEQTPVTNVKLALLGMCLSNITEKHRDANIFYFDTTSGIKHIFAEHLIDPDADEHSDSATQTDKIFHYLADKLSEFDATIQDNVLRTWLYAPHVDADYPGIVKARKELFDRINMTQNTHYIASTGIQGGTGNRFARVSMDAYAVQGINMEKVRYIQAPEHLCPTHVYGVTFERATAVELGQSDFLFISGTASIDKEGTVVHPGDVVKQTQRTLENVSALLAAAGFTPGDLSSFMVYLRDSSDYAFIKPVIDEYAGNLPAVYVRAPVCRPGWLIEIEATAARFIPGD